MGIDLRKIAGKIKDIGISSLRQIRVPGGRRLPKCVAEKEIATTLTLPIQYSIIYADAVSKSLGGQVRTTRHGKRLKKETVEKCPYIALAEEIGLQNNPCMTICLRQMKVIEKQKNAIGKLF